MAVASALTREQVGAHRSRVGCCVPRCQVALPTIHQEERVVGHAVAQLRPMHLIVYRDRAASHQHPFRAQCFRRGKSVSGLGSTVAVPSRATTARRLRRRQVQAAMAGGAHNQSVTCAGNPRHIVTAAHAPSGQGHYRLRDAASRCELLLHRADDAQSSRLYPCVTALPLAHTSQKGPKSREGHGVPCLYRCTADNPPAPRWWHF